MRLSIVVFCLMFCCVLQAQDASLINVVTDQNAHSEAQDYDSQNEEVLDVFVNDRRNIIKFNPQAFFHSGVKVYYERALNSIFSVEGGLAVFGIFEPIRIDKNGFTVEAVIKTDLSRLYSNRKDYPEHILSGLFLGAMIGFTELNEGHLGTIWDPTTNYNRRYLSLGLDLDLQLIRSEYLCFEGYVGLVKIVGKSERQRTGEAEPSNWNEFRDVDLKINNLRGIRAGFKLGYVFNGF